jgi:3-hydroxyisobutyrate dehydrogenase
MGAAIGERLLDEGAELVVWNRTPRRAEPPVARGATRLAAPAPADFALAGSARDLGLAVGAPSRAGGKATVARAALASAQEAVAHGWGGWDLTMQAAWRAGRRAKA